MAGSGLRYGTVRVGESDLRVAISREHWRRGLLALTADLARTARESLLQYLQLDPGFATAMRPYAPAVGAPDLARIMSAASLTCGVGPMAAVAGAIAAAVGEGLVATLAESAEVIVENGGDIWARLVTDRTVLIEAGRSPLSGKLGFRLEGARVWGVATSAGTVGPSTSWGRADAVTVVSHNAALADAAATAGGNRVLSTDDVEPTLDWLTALAGIVGACIIIGESVGVKGPLEVLAVGTR